MRLRTIPLVPVGRDRKDSVVARSHGRFRHADAGTAFAIIEVVALEALFMTMSRILVPTDFSDDAEAALEYALGLAQTFGASVHLLHVVDDPFAAGVWSSGLYAAEIAGLQATLVRDAEQRLQRTVPPTTVGVTSEVRIGHPPRQIVDVARERGIDLIVMGTHGRTGLAHIVMGSVAERVVRLAPCPVLTLRQHVSGLAAAVA